MNNIRKILIITLLYGALVPMLLIAGNRKSVTVDPPTLTTKGLKAVRDINELIAAEEFQTAEERCTDLINTSKPGTYDQALGNLLLSQTLLGVNRYEDAIGPLSQSLKTGFFNEEMEERYSCSLAHLHYETGDLPRSAEVMESLLNKIPRAKPETRYLYAVILMQQKRFEEAMNQAELVLQGILYPSAEHYQLAAAAAQEMNQPERALAYLERLVEINPSTEQYWKQLVSGHYATGNNLGILTALERAQSLGFMLDEKSLLTRIELYFSLERYETAIQLIRQYIENDRLQPTSRLWDLLIYCHDLQEEPDLALATLEEAAACSDTSGYDLRLAERYWRDKAYDKTIEKLEIARIKGGIENEGDYWILLASASLELGNLSQAERALAAAETLPHQTTRVARLRRVLKMRQNELEERN